MIPASHLRSATTLLTLALMGTMGAASVWAEAAAGGGATTPPAADGGNNANGNGGDRQAARTRRLIADNPELQGVDPNTPEGQEKIRAFMQARMEKMAPQMRQRMADQQTATNAKLREAFAMSADDFKAVEPLLTRVENLRLQQRLTAPQNNGNGNGGNRWGGAGGGGFNPQMLLGDTPLEPSIQEGIDAGKALKALIDDPQANAAEVDLALARVRKAHEAFQAVLTKAEADLQAVLSHRQEAVLVDRGILE